MTAISSKKIKAKESVVKLIFNSLETLIKLTNPLPFNTRGDYKKLTKLTVTIVGTGDRKRKDEMQGAPSHALPTLYNSSLRFSISPVTRLKACTASVQTDERNNTKNKAHESWVGCVSPRNLNRRYARLLTLYELTPKWFYRMILQVIKLIRLHYTIPIGISICLRKISPPLGNSCLHATYHVRMHVPRMSYTYIYTYIIVIPTNFLLGSRQPSQFDCSQTPLGLFHGRVNTVASPTPSQPSPVPGDWPGCPTGARRPETGDRRRGPGGGQSILGLIAIGH